MPRVAEGSIMSQDQQPSNPYAQQSQQLLEPPTQPPSQRPDGSVPWLVVAAGFVVAVAGPFLWCGLYKVQLVWMAPFLIGVGIGLAMRLLGRSAHPAIPVSAVILSVLSSAAGYVATDTMLIAWANNYQPTIGDAIGRFFRDFQMVVLVAFGAYLSFLIARRSGGG